MNKIGKITVSRPHNPTTADAEQVTVETSFGVVRIVADGEESAVYLTPPGGAPEDIECLWGADPEDDE